MPPLTFGDHQVGCGGNRNRIHRHDSLRDILFSAAQSAALAPREEVPSLIPGTSSRPADIFLPNWCRGHPAALDVTVISTLQLLTLVGAAATQGNCSGACVEGRGEVEDGRPQRGMPIFRYGFHWSNPWVAGAKRQFHNITRIGRLLGQHTARGNNPQSVPETAHFIVARQCLYVDPEAPYPPRLGGRDHLTRFSFFIALPIPV